MSQAPRDDWPVQTRHALQCVADELHLWRIPLDVDRTTYQQRAEHLTRDDQETARRFLRRLDGERFAACRGAVRDILSRYLNTPAKELEFEYGARGKPRLATSAGTEPLEFNVSNSKGMALLAVSGDTAVGVDLEMIRCVRDLMEIAVHYFAAEEVEVLKELDGDQRNETFFRAWTRKESLLKATGTGLSFPLSEVVVTLRPGDACRVVSFPGSTSENPWWLAHLDPAPGYVGAVAARKEFARIHQWSAE